ncbi:hypothetical protein SAMN05444344_1736 [Tenacibaculum mesophilum]|uniref:VCBS repeat-containing protein n=1 Tax=Tenacibaculum mesophilum TaxID=104268 RepID=A0ABM7CDS9_9FLAO|nr:MULTISPECIES: VCBS repeat-containing protein [Tenacibaculum]AZJ31901.1 VCBS repeat-containing protein [Tenacibaculum mesophilum]MCO7185398.1 VCBS repeat-containing protein [Tenacibaculum sp. XPcli2-G]QFS27156.1 hypothetical protein F9Y86_01545 [Tenacibaculum mesophilum]SHF85969.1 hypothetical protein SAMN05444344_1736 [Tenacibaculum mesophilum]
MKKFYFTIFLLISSFSFAQFPFEKLPSTEYKEYKNWKLYDWLDTKNTIHHTLTIDSFFDNKKSLTVQLTSLLTYFENTSTIRLFRNKKEICKFPESMLFSTINTGHDPIYVGDINGDGLEDIKMIIPYMGNGISAMNVRVIYLFQTQDSTFHKISFTDKMDTIRPEYDFDGDGNHEIITMTLTNYSNHNYWTFNIFEYKEGELKNVNNKANYPIMVQFLNKKNYTITNKIKREEMKKFSFNLPKDYKSK